MFVLGIGWLVLWSVVAGVSQNELTLDVARACAGLGPAAFLPSSVMLMGCVYRPGPRKNLVCFIFIIFLFYFILFYAGSKFIIPSYHIISYASYHDQY